MSTPKSRFDYKLPDDLQPKDKDRFTIKQPEVEIPVGGITPDGTLYEKEVRPDGNEPIYKEVKIDNTTTEGPASQTEKEETTSDDDKSQ